MNKTNKSFMASAVLFLLSLVFLGCEVGTGNVETVTGDEVTINGDETDTNGENSNNDSTAGVNKNIYYFPSTITYSPSAGDADVSFLLNNEWDYNGFIYAFRPNGFLDVPSCCCATGGVYIYINGNILVTWFGDGMYAGIQVTKFTIADGGVSFTRDNGGKGDKYVRGKTLVNSANTLSLTNDLIGTWQTEDGTKYIFNSDASLKINSDEYVYIVKEREIAFSPVAEGNQLVFQKYLINKQGSNDIYLSCKEGDSIKYFKLSRLNEK